MRHVRINYLSLLQINSIKPDVNRAIAQRSRERAIRGRIKMDLVRHTRGG